MNSNARLTFLLREVTTRETSTSGVVTSRNKKGAFVFITSNTILLLFYYSVMRVETALLLYIIYSKKIGRITFFGSLVTHSNQQKKIFLCSYWNAHDVNTSKIDRESKNSNYNTPISCVPIIM